MKKALILISFILAAVASFSFKGVVGKLPTSTVDTFVNKQTISSNNALYITKGGFRPDSALILPFQFFTDTTAANFSKAAGYNGSLVLIGTDVWVRTLNPNKWNKFALSSGGGYVLISDTALMLTPYLRKSDTAFMLSTRVKYSDTAYQMSGYVRKGYPVLYTDSANMLSPYLRKTDTANMLVPYVRNDRTITTNAPLFGGGDLSVNRTFGIDTGRANAQIPSGGDLNKVRDSLVGLISGGGFGTVLNVSTTDGVGIVSSVANPTSTPNISIRVDTVSISTRAWRQKGDDSLGGLIALKVNISDTATMLSPYLRKSDTATMLSPFVQYSDTAYMLSNRLKISDTAYMLSNRLKISDTAYMLSNRLKISDTATMLSRGWLANRSADSISVLRTLINTKGTGTVTSVSLSLPAMFSVSGSPVTTSGTLTASLANQTANMVFSGPTTGSPAQPTFRALVAADLPDSYLPISDTSSMLSGYLPLTAGVGKPLTGDLYGTGANFSGGTILSGRVGASGMRSDATVVIRDSTFPFMVFELTKNGLANPDEGGIAAYGRDLSSNLYKIASIAMRVVDNTGGNAYGGIRLNSGTYQGGIAQDRPVLNTWGNGNFGSASMFYSGITPEADSTLKIYGALVVAGTTTSNKIIKLGGTSSEFLKADGSVDANTYLTTSSAASTYAPLTGAGASGTWGINITGTAASETLGTVTARGNYVAPNTTGLQMDFGSIGIQSYSLNDAWIGDNVYYNGGFKYSRTGTAGRIYFQGGGITLATAPSGTAGTTAFFTDAISINNASGNVSIGGGSGNLSANAGTFGSTVKGLRFIGNSGTDNTIDAVQSGGGSILSNLYRMEGKIQATSTTIDATATVWNDNTNGSTVTYTLPGTSSLSGGFFGFIKTGTGNLTLSGTIVKKDGTSAGGTLTLASTDGLQWFWFNGTTWYQSN